MIQCPFCKEDDFDLPGLAGHFDHCKAYDKAREEILNDRLDLTRKLIEISDAAKRT